MDDVSTVISTSSRYIAHNFVCLRTRNSSYYTPSFPPYFSVVCKDSGKPSTPAPLCSASTAVLLTGSPGKVSLGSLTNRVLSPTSNPTLIFLILRGFGTSLHLPVLTTSGQTGYLTSRPRESRGSRWIIRRACLSSMGWKERNAEGRCGKGWCELLRRCLGPGGIYIV